MKFFPEANAICSPPVFYKHKDAPCAFSIFLFSLPRSGGWPHDSDGWGGWGVRSDMRVKKEKSRQAGGIFLYI